MLPPSRLRSESRFSPEDCSEPWLCSCSEPCVLSFTVLETSEGSSSLCDNASALRPCGCSCCFDSCCLSCSFISSSCCFIFCSAFLSEGEADCEPLVLDEWPPAASALRPLGCSCFCFASCCCCFCFICSSCCFCFCSAFLAEGEADCEPLEPLEPLGALAAADWPPAAWALLPCCDDWLCCEDWPFCLDSCCFCCCFIFCLSLIHI